MSTKILLQLISLAVLLSLSAFAVDGTILINQASVMAAGGFPYVITQPGSYKLSGNLIVPFNTDGIDINAGDVLLDLNGFSVKGPGTCNGSFDSPPTVCNGNAAFADGIVALKDNVTIKNGSVEGFSLGIFGGHLVEEVHFSNNVTGVQVGPGIVRRCTARNNNGGITVFGGIAEGNEVDGNQEGIVVYEGAATGNSVNHNVYGFQPQKAVYGSNSFQQNTWDIAVFVTTVNVSQNNNICTSGPC